MAKQTTPGYQYELAFDASPKARTDQPEMPAPPTSDHPMVAFAKQLLAPMRLPEVPPYEVPVLGGALRGADVLQRATIDAGSGLVGIGLQKLAEPFGGRGREEQAVTSAVTAET